MEIKIKSPVVVEIDDENPDWVDSLKNIFWDEMVNEGSQKTAPKRYKKLVAKYGAEFMVEFIQTMLLQAMEHKHLVVTIGELTDDDTDDLAHETLQPSDNFGDIGISLLSESHVVNFDVVE